MGRVTKRGSAVAALVVATAATEAAAHPQIGARVTTGAALTDVRESHGPRLAYHLGGRFDLLLLRERPDQMAVGPYLDLGTAAFDTFETGGGVSWLVPAGGPVFVLSGGAFGRSSALGWQPGAVATLFWGSRSYNYHSVYGLGVGLFAQGRYGLGDSRQADVIAGVEVDLAYLALPFILAVEAVRR